MILECHFTEPEIRQKKKKKKNIFSENPMKV